MYFVLGPLVSREHLGGAQAWGLILTGGAIGGVLGGLVAYRVKPSRPAAAAFAAWAWGAALPLAMIRPLPLPVLMCAGAVLSLSIIFGNTLWETALQQEVRPDRLARVGSIDWPLSLCLMPAGQALAGPVSEGIGVRATLLLAAGLMLVPNLCVLVFVREVRQLRRRDAPDPALAS